MKQIVIFSGIVVLFLSSSCKDEYRFYRVQTAAPKARTYHAPAPRKTIPGSPTRIGPTTPSQMQTTY